MLMCVLSYVYIFYGDAESVNYFLFSTYGLTAENMYTELILSLI